MTIRASPESSIGELDRPKIFAPVHFRSLSLNSSRVGWRGTPLGGMHRMCKRGEQERHSAGHGRLLPTGHVLAAVQAVSRDSVRVLIMGGG